MILASALVVVGLGQVGRLPVPLAYWHSTERVYRTAIQRAHGEARRADVLLLGDSRIQFGLRADELARHLRLPGMGARSPHVVNLAVFGGIPPGALWLWRQATQSRRDSGPQLLLLGAADIDLTARSPGRDYSVRYLYDARAASWLAWSGQYDDAATLLTFRAFPFYARRRTIGNLLMRREQTLLVIRREERGGRWLPMYWDWYRDYRIDSFQTRCLEQLIREAKARGTRVVVVAPPVERGLLKLGAGALPPPGIEAGTGWRASADRSKAPLVLFHAAMADIVSRTDVPYFDYLTPQDSVRFGYDASAHLSPESAVEFSREIAERINRELASETGSERIAQVNGGRAPAEGLQAGEP
ncbi:MAG: hypothetical protein JSV65_06695 [Armatimonadota bacterium]|nr:MAG: hypothetical protein JSV65_06695 [Armatimonadota bacterium]